MLDGVARRRRPSHAAKANDSAGPDTPALQPWALRVWI
jgi:hypothetical protein